MSTSWIGAVRSWEQVVAVLEQQDGVIGRRDLDRLQVTKAELQTMIRHRHLERAAPRVWRLVGSQPTWRQQLRIGLLSLGPLSWVSHEAAAQLHRFDRTPGDRVEFLVLRSRRGGAFPGCVHTTRRWSSVDAVEVDGLRATSATRTVLDLANSGVSPNRLAAAIDTAVRLELSSPEAIRIRLDEVRRSGWAGVRVLEGQLVDSGGHTMLERRFLELVRVAGLPRPDTQRVIDSPADGRFVARVDFCYPDLDLVVEVTGRVGHSSPDDRARDAQRRNELLELGQRVYEFTWEDVTGRPAVVVSQLRRALAAHH